jgi:galactofuranose transport system permease protein
MMARLNVLLAKNRKFLPLAATIVLFIVAYSFGASSYKGMRDPQVFFTLFIITPFLLISAVGETFVVFTGGIDLSVSGIVALTATASAALLRGGMNPWLVFGLMILMGMALGATMGSFIAYLKVQPFIATLAGLWFARGMCYIISDLEIRIYNPLYKLLAGTKILIPGLADVVTKKGAYITPLVVFSMVIFGIALYIAHYTKLGRSIYAIGGNGGGNEQSAKLMGLRTDRTKVIVYMISGLCSALAGIAYSIYVGSGHGTHATGFEMTVIASVVIGGTMLTGGEGYMFGTLFGVLTTALIQTLIQFNGKLSSWWTSIAIGVLTLVFIGVQSLLVNLNAKKVSAHKLSGAAGELAEKQNLAARRKKTAIWGAVAVILVAASAVVFTLIDKKAQYNAANPPTEVAKCTQQPFRHDVAQKYVDEGAVITYERNGGEHCVDELYALFPDGRIIADNGTQTVEANTTPEKVTTLLTSINGMGWFTDNMYSTHHKPCDQCFDYFTTVVYDGQTKTIEAVDGGTDAPAKYWQMSGQIGLIVPKFDSAE